MTLAMTSTATCTLCRCRIRGVIVGPARVTKTSLAFHRSLTFREPSCPECGWETTSAPQVWRLDEESQAKVDAARGRRRRAAVEAEAVGE